ncbi:ribose-5-phosphate isomerase RpiA [Aestuariibius insulae]|uniref:ribose-5-phosphate isomerase RpiA n=1 Tax=Aestuariibius insulae TaxID=2058287 RepID=UPI00345EAD99
MPELSPIDTAKFAAAREASQLVKSGMTVGLGTGSTAAWMVRCLGERVRNEGLKIRGVPTSTRTAKLAQDVGIEVLKLDEAGWLDLTIDGTDEYDPDLNLIKGAGGALLQEKIVATASNRMVVIADSSKTVAGLGAFPLSIEVIPFGLSLTKQLIEEMLSSLDVAGRTVSQRMVDGQPFVTDEGNQILDLHLRRIGKPHQLSLMLNQVPGVVENGLFLDICDTVFLGHEDGHVDVIEADADAVREPWVDLDGTENLFADLPE